MDSEADKRGEAIFAPGLPVELEGGSWWGRVGRTLGAIVFRANRSFLAVAEPVRHGPALTFIASLRLPTWGVLVLASLFDWFGLPSDVEATIETTAATRMFGLQLGQVLATWSVIMMPLRIPVLYFIVGLWAHVLMALTGGAHRSIGASMRAMGFALAPTVMVLGVLELMASRGAMPPMLWLYIFVALISLGWVLASVALARTHGASLVHGFAVSLVPVLIFAVFAMASALFFLEWSPLTGPPPPPNYLIPLPNL